MTVLTDTIQANPRTPRRVGGRAAHRPQLARPRSGVLARPQVRSGRPSQPAHPVVARVERAGQLDLHDGLRSGVELALTPRQLSIAVGAMLLVILLGAIITLHGYLGLGYGEGGAEPAAQIAVVIES